MNQERQDKIMKEYREGMEAYFKTIDEQWKVLSSLLDLLLTKQQEISDNLQNAIARARELRKILDR